ncbi:MAG: TRAP transporter small permease [Alphaproteobacteria bacterium]
MAAVNRWFMAAATLLVALMVAIILFDVISRSFFNAPTLWAFDLVRFALLYATFLGLAPALAGGSHIVVDMFDPLLPKIVRPAVPFLAAGLTLAFGIVLLWHVADLTHEAFADGRTAQATIAVPEKWIWLPAPIGTALFVAAAAIQLGRAFWPAKANG